MSGVRGDWLAALGISALAILLQLPTFDRTMSLLDEGHILQFADLVRRGGALYRDATLLPLPGAFWLLALAFDVFGPSIVVARWIVVVEFALFAAVCFGIVRQLAPRSVAAGAVVGVLLYKVWAFPHWQMYSYSTTAQLLLALAVLAVMRFQGDGRLRLVAAAGLATGLAILCKQDYGGAGLVAFTAALSITTTGRQAAGPGILRTLLVFAAPVALVGAVTALVALWRGVFGEMLQQTVQNHLIGISSGTYTSLPPLLPLSEPDPMLRTPYGIGAYAPSILFTVDWPRVAGSALLRSVAWDWMVRAIFYGPYLLAGLAALRLFARRAALRDPDTRLATLRELTLALFAIAALAALNRPVDYVHVVVLTWPWVLLVAIWIHWTLRARPGWRLPLAVAAALPIALLVGYSGLLQLRLHRQYDTPLRGDRAGVFVAAREEAVVGEAVDWLRAESRPGERTAVLPYFPLLSFLAERDAPHAETYTLWPIEYDPGRQADVVRSLEAAAPVALYHFTQAAQLPRMREYAPEIFGHLVERWTIERVFTDPGWGYMMAGLRRRDAPPEGRPVLAADEALPPARIEGGGRESESEGPWARRDRWPFREVIALRPSCVGRTLLTLPLEVPENALLRTAVGVDPVLWFRHPPSWVEFTIEARADGVADGALRPLFRRRLDPHRNAADRRWVEVELDLSELAGPIELTLGTRCQNASGAAFAMGGFELPRIVTRDATEELARLEPGRPLWQSPQP